MIIKSKHIPAKNAASNMKRSRGRENAKSGAKNIIVAILK